MKRMASVCMSAVLSTAWLLAGQSASAAGTEHASKRSAVGSDKHVSAAKPSAKKRARSSHDTADDKTKNKKHTASTSHTSKDDADKLEAGEVSGGHGKHASTLRQHIHHAAHGTTAAPAKGPCLHEPVQVERIGGDSVVIALTTCDGHPAPKSIEQLSILARPSSAPKPDLALKPVRHMSHEKEWAPGVKLVDSGLVTRLQRFVDRFGKKKIEIVSGYRPASLGSFHQSARALDLRVEGVANEDVVNFCRSIPDTGCGYYPNSTFVHVDVRAPRTGHVYWIDASGPGEPAHYVASWPLKQENAHALDIPQPDPAAPADENTHPDVVSSSVIDRKIDARTTAPRDVIPIDEELTR